MLLSSILFLTSESYELLALNSLLSSQKTPKNIFYLAKFGSSTTRPAK